MYNFHIRLREEMTMGKEMECEMLRNLYLEKGYNCAEATLMTMGDQLGLDICEEDVKLIGAFGGGMGCGEACGALCASIAVIGLLEIKGKAHDTPQLKGDCAEFVCRFREKMGGSVNCRDIKERNTIPGQRCYKTVIENYEILKEFLDK